MIASYKIDEICHKNENVCLYRVFIYTHIHSIHTVYTYIEVLNHALVISLSFTRFCALFIMNLGAEAISERHSAIINGYDEKYFYINSVWTMQGGRVVWCLVWDGPRSMHT